MVNECGAFYGEEWKWSLSWDRSFNTNEFFMLVELWMVLCRFQVNRDKPDSFRWNGSKDGSFSTRSMHNSLIQEADDEQYSSIDMSRIWCKTIPLKVLAFTWKLLLNRIATKNSMAKSRILPNNNGECVLCQNCHETFHHLFLECLFASHNGLMWGNDWKLCPLHTLQFFSIWTASFQRGEGRNQEMLSSYLTMCCLENLKCKEWCDFQECYTSSVHKIRGHQD